MESIVPYGHLLVCEKYHKQIIIKTNISLINFLQKLYYQANSVAN
jgi:hypothetical protein